MAQKDCLASVITSWHGPVLNCGGIDMTYFPGTGGGMKAGKGGEAALTADDPALGFGSWT